jgi:CheY-like chemotaxis protein
VAQNGKEAVDTFRDLQGRIALVLLDMTMPGIPSEEALHQLKAIRADVPVVISSGYSEEEALERFGDLGVAAFIQKPYTSRSLLQKIRRLLR